MWSLALIAVLDQAPPPALARAQALVPALADPNGAAPLPPVSLPPNAEPAPKSRRAPRHGPLSGHLAVAYEGRTWSKQPRWLSSVQLAGGLETGFGLTANLTVAPTSPVFTTLQQPGSSTTIGARLHQLPVTAELGYIRWIQRVGLEAVAAGGVLIQQLSTTTIPFDTDGSTPLVVQREWYSDGLMGAHAALRVRITPHFSLRFRAGVEVLLRHVSPVVRFLDGTQTTTAVVAEPERVRGVFSLGFSFRP